ncbi:hypothetical protein [Aquipuribacter nitratireducens]|uniref:Response regulatory domain-containing protein n=1 Tax=Aquipuribacter nitratireducens TaxID=650104 RepID=A0ABW0GSS3_9MICO
MSATSSSGSLSAAPDPAAQEQSERCVVAVYSDDRTTREAVRRAVGRRPAADVALVEWHEFATLPALLRAVDTRRFDVLVLDGEAAPAGGLGVARQLKDEIYDCPPVLVLTGRPQDAWLAAWSKAEAAVPHPLDPRALADAVAGLARRRAGGRAAGARSAT